MMADNAYKFSRSYSNDYAEANLIHMPTNNTTKSLLRYVVTFVRMLSNSEGRNKICGLIQYISKFSAACIIYTIDTSDLRNNIDHIEFISTRHANLKRIEKSMSNGRKIFRFLKFIEDFKKFYSYLFESSFNSLTILKVFTTLASCFYHFLDNLVWASNVGMINRIITGEIGWKSSKNFFSLIRTLIKLATSLIDFKTFYYSSWMNSNDEIKNENYENIINETIKMQSKLRMITLDLVHSLLKLTTLIYSMKMEPFYSHLHPIIVTLCGIVYSVISIFKIYYKTKEGQKKILKEMKKSNENLFKSTSNLNGLYSLPKGSAGNLVRSIRRRHSFELALIDSTPNQKLLLDQTYFDNYYIDFNKDYPTTREDVLKANGGSLSKLML